MMKAAALALRALAITGMAVFIAAPSFPIEAPSRASIQAELGLEAENTLAQMSTGSDQALVETRGDAQTRNKAIPAAPRMAQALPDYRPMASGSAAYQTALKCMTQAIYYEAANEPRKGKHAVGQVIMNRLRHPAYPNTVCGVVYEGVNRPVCQFSFTCDGALLRKPLADKWRDAQTVAVSVLAGEQMAEVGTATHYHADYVVPKWAYTLTKLRVVGRHIFYRFPGHSGDARSFQARWSGFERIPQINWGRFAGKADAAPVAEVRPEDNWVEGLTVAPDPTDRHAKHDVGGRIDTTKQWRLSVPDPVTQPGSYQSAIVDQGSAPSQQEQSE
jgi:spore germination cell wall hydrolase CwlJ-like protein